MTKIIIGTSMIIAGIAISFTGIGLIIGIPLVIVGFGSTSAGFLSLGGSTIKGGIAVARAVSKKDRNG